MVIGHVRNVGKSTLRNGSYVSRVKYQKKEFNPLEMRVDNLKTCWRVIGTVRNVVHIILHGETDVMDVVSRATLDLQRAILLCLKVIGYVLSVGNTILLEGRRVLVAIYRDFLTRGLGLGICKTEIGSVGNVANTILQGVLFVIRVILPRRLVKQCARMTLEKKALGKGIGYVPNVAKTILRDAPFVSAVVLPNRVRI